jgi:hypothetical protein
MLHMQSLATTVHPRKNLALKDACNILPVIHKVGFCSASDNPTALASVSMHVCTVQSARGHNPLQLQHSVPCSTTCSHFCPKFQTS